VPPADPKELARIYIGRGNGHLAQRAFDRALPDYGMAAALDPANSRALNGQGLVFQAQNQLDRAIANFDDAIRLAPKDPLLWTNRGNAYREMGRFDLALRDYDGALAVNPKWVNALFGRAATLQEQASNDFDAYLNEGRFEQLAIEAYGKVLEVAPKAVGAYNNRGQLYVLLRKYDLAIADFTQAITISPKNPIFLINRALTYRTTRRVDLAIADYRAALTLATDAAVRKAIEGALDQLGATA